MNDLLFYAILIALLYYFFIYLPNKKKLNANASPPLANPPLKHNKATQTETIITENEPGPEMINCPGPQKDKDKELTELKSKNKQLTTEITKLKAQISELVKRPARPISNSAKNS